ncbi:porin [Caballeronia sp. GACF5]|uniref:porin n=1 Tax=Caballeronia sp. GACF5 TaxID=2921746 RepID=UPI002028B05B|nr:porin [Caballeronia sp. GACF5]
MRKKMIHKVLAIALPILYACSAYAQSSVTLYGVVDEGIDYVSNSGGSKLIRMRDGTYDGVYGSRWGLQGNEDLGGGLSAIFKLENGFSLENGQARQGGLLFGRQAYVGLTHNTYGTVTFGRQYDSVVDYLQPISSTGLLGGPVQHANDIDNEGNSYRVNNSIKYASPKIGGLQFGGMYALSNTNAPGRSTTGMWSVGATYSLGGLTVAGAYEFAKDPALVFADGNYQQNTTGAAIGASGPWSYVGNPSNVQIYGAGVAYTIGPAVVGLNYSNVKFDNANGTTATVKFQNYEAVGTYNITPAWSTGLSYTYTHGDIGYNEAVPIYHLVGLMTQYALSKRTALYAYGAYQRSAGNALYGDIFDGAVASASSNNHQAMVRIGIYHRF